MTVLVLGWLWLARPSSVVAIEGGASCPASEEVSARVGALLPARRGDAAPDVARLDDVGGRLRVTLRRPDGALIGERTLDGGAPCADLAAAAAVVVAAWESDVHSEFRLAPIPARPADADLQVVTQPPAARSNGSAFDLGAAVSGSLAPVSASVGAAAGAAVVGSWTPQNSRLGVRLAGAGTMQRELPLDSARVLWRRFDAAMGPQLRFAVASRWALDLHVEALVGWLTAAGTGFANNRSDSSVEPGAGAGVRLLWGGHAVAPWIDLSATRWLRAQTAYVTPDGASIALPRLDATLALGVSYRTGP
jgi:hypothetical protein